MKVPFDVRIPGTNLPAPLRPWVHEYYSTGLDILAGETLRIPVSATTEPTLNVTYSGSVVVHIGAGFSIPPVTLAGPQPAAYALEARGELRGVYVRFTTTGPLALLGIEDYSLTDGARPLHEMVPPDLKAATRGWEEDRRDPFPENTVVSSSELWEAANGSAIWISPDSEDNEVAGNTRTSRATP